jgi:hypothetical protein
MAPLTLLTPVLTHLQSSPSERPPPSNPRPMLHARIGKAVETTEAIAKHARSGLDVVKGIVLDRLLGEGGDAAQLRIDRSAVPCFDGHHERDFVRRSAPSLSSFFTTLVGIVDLYIAGKPVGGIALLHYLHQLLIDEPGSRLAEITPATA